MKNKRVFYQTKNINRNRLIQNEQLRRLKEQLLDLINHTDYQPMKIKEIAILLNIPKDHRKELNKALDDLLSEGAITLSTKGKYGKRGQFTNTGIFSLTKQGFGFVITDNEDEADIFIGKDHTLNAFTGDLVAFSIIRANSDGSHHSEGRISKIIEHKTTELVGRVEQNKNFAFVVPKDSKIPVDLYVHNEDLCGAVTGDMVVAKIIEYPDSPFKNPVAVIQEILGKDSDTGMDVLAVAKASGIPMEFPEEVMDYVTHKIPTTVSAKEIEGRMDLRDVLTITIDGEDAKDLDDAITVKVLENGNFELGVHIADVTNYVKENSPLDIEALKRGTSVYLIDRVIPMLPRELSNGICSLNQKEDRLALSCIMEINQKGIIVGHTIAETVINVDHRMTYTDVACMLSCEEEDQDLRKELEETYPDLIEFVALAAKISELIRAERGHRGAVDFDFPEAKILLDPETREVLSVKPYARNQATKLIEDFMLCANETIAEDYYWQDLPFLYRVHQEPDYEKMQQFSEFINHFGYSLHMANLTVHPKELQKLMDKLEGSPYEALISRVMLRSMKKAKYDPECLGHFGLSAKYYTHFTSPIRRYPDLQIHRIIKENLHGGLSTERKNHYYDILLEVARQSSATEVRAEEAEREVVKIKKAQYMSEQIGAEFDGVISGVQTWGFYVELDNTVEGLVRLISMKDDYYEVDKEQYVIRGTRTGKEYMVGQQVKVKVKAVDSTVSTIDFELV